VRAARSSRAHTRAQRPGPRQRRAAAARALRERHDLVELRLRHCARVVVADVVQEVEVLGHIAARVEEQAVACDPVAARAAGLLVVALDVLRKVGVHHEADIRLVDAHAERDRRRDDAHLVAQERLLVAGAHILRKPRVVRTRGDSRAFKRVGDRLGRLARLAVDDARLVAARADERDRLRARVVLRGVGTSLGSGSATTRRRRTVTRSFGAGLPGPGPSPPALAGPPGLLGFARSFPDLPSPP
jgi:hypothetical protein